MKSIVWWDVVELKTQTASQIDGFLLFIYLFWTVGGSEDIVYIFYFIFEVSKFKI